MTASGTSTWSNTLFRRLLTGITFNFVYLNIDKAVRLLISTAHSINPSSEDLSICFKVELHPQPKLSMFYALS